MKKKAHVNPFDPRELDGSVLDIHCFAVAIRFVADHD